MDKESADFIMNRIDPKGSLQDARWLFKSIRNSGLNFYKCNAVLAELLRMYYRDPKDNLDVEFFANKYYKHLKLDQQETNHVHIMFQNLFDILGARAISDEEWELER